MRGEYLNSVYLHEAVYLHRVKARLGTRHTAHKRHERTDVTIYIHKVVLVADLVLVLDLYYTNTR